LTPTSEMLQINLIPIDFTPERTRKKTLTTSTPHSILFTPSAISSTSSSLLDIPNPKEHSTRPPQHDANATPLPPSQLFALREIYGRYTSGATSKRLALSSITRQSHRHNTQQTKTSAETEPTETSGTYATQVQSIGSHAFYLDTSGEVKAQAFAFIRKLYNDTGLHDMTLGDFLNYYTSTPSTDTARDTKVWEALQLHGYTIDRRHYPNPLACVSRNRHTRPNALPLCLRLVAKALGLRGFAHLSQHISHPDCAVATLDLSHNQCPDIAAHALASSLASNGSLRTLDLSHNRLGPNFFRTLQLSVASNPNLPLSRLTLVQVGMARHTGSIDAVGDLIRTSPYLTYLDLSHNDLGNVHAQALASALVDRSTLSEHRHTASGGSTGRSRHKRTMWGRASPGTHGGVCHLRVLHNRIGHYGASALGNACSHARSSITTLNLSHNPLGCVGGSFLSQCLKTSTTLRTLVLNHCALGMPLSANDGDRQGRDTAAVVQTTGHATGQAAPHDATGLYELIAALGYSTSLTSLSVSGNYCAGDPSTLFRATQVLCRQLPNTQLTHLDLSSLGLGCRGMVAIGQALRKASGVDELHTLQQRHQVFLQDNQQQLDRVEQELGACVAKLQQVRQYVTDKKQALSHDHDAFQLKNQHIVQHMVRHASRHSPVKAARVAQATQDKMHYTHRRMGRHAALSARMDELDALETAPARHIDVQVSVPRLYPSTVHRTGID
jgi:Ran GTPase-activating protein (RanGAP) involved in mRNA processing and transport